jgi:hypothetical protein|tara:strand:- start:483 stop:656 length:174 start_codon:yes stop_codon:yes gene_type:complete
MVEKCVLCDEGIEEEFGKLKGTVIKDKDENGKRLMIYVCSDCMKKDDWYDEARVMGV